MALKRFPVIVNDQESPVALTFRSYATSTRANLTTPPAIIRFVFRQHRREVENRGISVIRPIPAVYLMDADRRPIVLAFEILVK